MIVRMILVGVLVFGAGGELGRADEGNGGGPLEGMSLGKRGTSTTFIKRREIKTGDRFSRGIPPLPAEHAVDNLSRYDAIWAAGLVAANNPEAWRLLRQKHPDILTLTYISSDTTRFHDGGYFDYQYINTHHPEWFVLKDAKHPARADPRNPDNRVRWSRSDPTAPNYNRFYLDVGNPDFQAWAVQQILSRVTGQRRGLTQSYHGLAADNVNIGARRMGSISARHPHWSYAGRIDDWNEGFCRYLKAVKEALNKRDFILVANHSLSYGSDADSACWDSFLDSVDGVMTEQSLRHRGSLYADEAWLSSIEKHERILDRGLIDWWTCRPSKSAEGGYEEFLYYYCSWLLVKRPGRSFFFATKGEPGWSNPEAPWYKEYDLPIGDPGSSRYRKEDCWVREYAGALVVVNPTRKPQTLRLDKGGNWVDPSTHQPRTTLQLPPTSGRILMVDRVGAEGH